MKTRPSSSFSTEHRVRCLWATPDFTPKSGCWHKLSIYAPTSSKWGITVQRIRRAAFINAVHLRLAVVSVGRHKLFGHAAPATLETLRGAGASIFRTDQCGAVTIAIEATGKLTVDTMLSCDPPFRLHR